MPDATPLPEDQVTRDFVAGRAVAQRGGDDWMRDAAATRLDALLPSTSPAPTPGASPPTGAVERSPAAVGAAAGGAPTSPIDKTLPLGLQVDQAGAASINAAATANGGDAGSGETFPNQLRAMVKNWPVPESGLSVVGTAKSLVNGFADLLEYTHGDVPAGQDISPDAKAALATFGTASPAAGSGRAIAAATEAKTVGDAGDVLTAAFGDDAGAEVKAAAQAQIDARASAEPAGAQGAVSAPAAAAGGETAAPAAAAESARPKPAFALVGNEGAGLKVTPEIRDQAMSYLTGGSGDNPVQASLDRIANTGAMTQAIKDVASFIPPDSIKPDDVLRMGAYAIGMSPEDALGTLTGRLPDDEHMAAWAMLVNSGAKQLGDFAQKAVEEGTPEAWQDATRAYALQNQILGEWTSAGTEMGRAFRARQLVWDTRSDYAAAIHDIVTNVGSDNIEQAVRKIAALQTPEQQSAFVGNLRWMGSREGLLYGWYNMLLGPKTVAKKVLTDVLTPVWNVAVRYAAEKAGSGAVPQGETAQLIAGYTGAFGDAVRAAGRGLMAGRSQFLGAYQTMDGLTKTRLSALVNGAPATLSQAQPTYSALAYLRAALPTSWIAGADDGAKVFNYRAELRALAYREGVDKGLDGSELGAHVVGSADAPSQAIHEQAVTAALANTYQEPLTGVAEKLSEAADGFNIPIGRTGIEIPAGRILLPFSKTPANFVRFMYRQSPLPLAFPTKAFQAEIARGGADRDLAYARIGLGSALSMTVGGLAIAGYITGRGPSDPQLNRAWRDAGNEPYSIQIPGLRPVSYPVEPFAQHIGAIADTVDLMKFAKDGDRDQAALSLGLGIGHAFLSRTYMSGLSDFLDAVQHPDTEGSRWVDQLVASMTVPRVVSDFAGAQDPWVRAHYDFLHTIESKFPFASQNLPYARTIWGDPIRLRDAYMPPFTGTGAAHMVSPVQLGWPAEDAEPIDKWIWENRRAFPDSADGRLGLSKPGITQSFSDGRGVQAQLELSPQQHDRLQVLAGNELKDPATGLGAKDTLNALVMGRHPNAAYQRLWNEASPAEQALEVQSVVMKARQGARQQLVRENPDLQDMIGAGFAARRQQLQKPAAGAMPQMQ